MYNWKYGETSVLQHNRLTADSNDALMGWHMADWPCKSEVMEESLVSLLDPQQEWISSVKTKH